MRFSTATDNSRFGNIVGGLDNGVILRRNVDSVLTTIRTWKNNDDIISSMGNLVSTDKAGGGDHGLSAVGLIKELTGAVIKLDSATDDAFEVWIQDDVTNLVSMRIEVKGHREDA